MTQLLVQIDPGASPGPCTRCGHSCDPTAGPLLLVAEGLVPICRACAGRDAPAVALARLADEATRVARIGRHNVFPPYNVLLELARAADVYATSLEKRDAG
jgi:hypothetical protein